MNVVLQIHLAFGFFIFLLGLIVGWFQPGRRLLVAIIGFQIALGVIVAGWAGARHITLPGTLWIHIVGGLLAMAAYIVARRLGARSITYRPVALAISLLGLVLIVFTVWYGSNLVHSYPIVEGL